jgi:hypothetical protein
MTAALGSALGSVVRIWTRLYTVGLPANQQLERRSEIASDLWELEHDATSTASARAIQTIARLLLGIPFDLLWRLEQEQLRSWVGLRPARVLVSMALASTLSLSASPQHVDLAKSVQVEVISQGWIRTDGPHSLLVPAFSFGLRNTSAEPLSSVEINAEFHTSGQREAWGGPIFVFVRGSRGLEPGHMTPPVSLSAKAGCSDLPQDPRLEGMDPGRRPVDGAMVVTLFAKSRSPEWTRLGDYPISRELIDH